MKWRSFDRNGKGISCLLRFCYLFLGCAAFVSCDREDVNAVSETGRELEFKLGAGINGISRAVDAGFEMGDTLGLYLVKWRSDAETDTLKPSGNYEDNVRFTLLDANDNWLPEHAVYFPADNRNIDIYAYYPYQAAGIRTGTQLNLSVVPDQTVYSAYTYSDFMVAKNTGVKRTPKKVPLVFDHKLSQIVFELLPGEGFTKDDLLGAQVKVVNAVTNATFDLAGIMDAVPVAGEKRADILPFGGWTKTDTSLVGVKAILIPQEINANTYIQLSLGSRRFTFKPSSIQLNSGCSRRFSITVNNTGLDISTTINPWDNCPVINGDAEEEYPEDEQLELLFYAPLKDNTVDVISGNSISGGVFEDGGYKRSGATSYDIDSVTMGIGHRISFSMYAKHISVDRNSIYFMGWVWNPVRYYKNGYLTAGGYGLDVNLDSIGCNIREWTHIVWTMDENCYLKIYINKQLVKEGAYDSSNFPNPGYVIYGKMVLFGEVTYAEGNGTCVLKEVRLYKGILNQEDINNL